MKKISLRKQLFLISGIIVSIIIITLGIILPRLLTPIYEENIYNKLKQPLIFINNNSSNTINYDTDIAYIYIVNGEIKLTYNVNKVITNYSPEILKYITNDRKILKGKELDIYIPSHKLAIECNGCYWHSQYPKEYHYNKFISCKEKEIQLVTVWEDQILNNPEKIESLILSKLGIYERRLYARECSVH